MDNSLFQAIFKRKSIRKYEIAPLDEATLRDISDRMAQLKRINQEIKIEIKVVAGSLVKNLLPIKAPHYLLVSSENKEGYLTNVGYMLQQMDLYFSSNGMGSCWVGMARPAKSIALEMKYEFVIAMAFGEAEETLHRESILEFKRKTVEEITNTHKEDSLFEATRLAPSATNSQPWLFAKEEREIHVYCIKSNLLKALIYEKMNRIDVGIGILHLSLSLEQEGKGVEFVQNHQAMNNNPKGYYYITTLKIHERDKLEGI